MSLLSIENLDSHFLTGDGVVRAVDDVSLEIGERETLGSCRRVRLRKDCPCSDHTKGCCQRTQASRAG